MVNASPLIVLGKLGQLDLLSSLCAELVVPAAVVREVCAGPADAPPRRALEAEELDRREPVLAVDSVVAAWDLGAGEAEVLTTTTRTGYSPEREAGSVRRGPAAYERRGGDDDVPALLQDEEGSLLTSARGSVFVSAEDSGSDPTGVLVHDVLLAIHSDRGRTPRPAGVERGPAKVSRCAAPPVPFATRGGMH